MKAVNKYSFRIARSVPEMFSLRQKEMARNCFCIQKFDYPWICPNLFPGCEAPRQLRICFPVVAVGEAEQEGIWHQRREDVTYRAQQYRIVFNVLAF